jgi:ATP-dependent Clp protease ATP-binding subunit ClpC
MANERFTQAALSVLEFAKLSALRRGAATVDTDDLVYAIALEQKSAAARAILEFIGDYHKLEELLFPSNGYLPAQPQSTRSRRGIVPDLNSFAKEAIQKAFNIAKEQNAALVGPEQILLGVLLSDSSNLGCKLLIKAGVDLAALKTKLRGNNAALANDNYDPSYGGAKYGPNTSHAHALTAPVARTTELDKYTTDLTELARQRKIHPVYGRDAEILSIIDILGLLKKNNPIIIGEPGVGKTAIMEGLAFLIISGKVPKGLRSARMLLLDLAALTAGTSLRGEFEERVKLVIAEVKKAGNIVLAIDEIHTVVGAGAAQGTTDLSNMLKGALQDGLRLVGTTTLDEYRRIEKDQALARRFQPVVAKEPDISGTIEIIKALKPLYEDHHLVKISDAIIELAAKLSDQYISGRNQPDKTIDVIDQAGSHLRQTAVDDAVLTMTEQDVSAVVSRISGVPVTQLTKSEREKLLGLEAILHQRVIGQEQAVKAVSAAMRRAGTRLKAKGRPIASFIFSGPTGVGKTELAKTLAKVMFGSEDKMIRLDMSEYMERHTVSRLVGSPPGYVGYDEGGQLTKAVHRNPYTVVLFDEIEKAHPDVFNVLLQVLDDGRLTDSQGRTVDFKNTVIIMTTNVGSSAIEGKNQGLGFDFESKDAKAKVESLYQTIKEKVLTTLKQYFRPEFLNRISETIVFRSLEKEQLYEIIDVLLLETQESLAEQGVSISLTANARDILINHGYSAQFGARALQRAITDLLDDELAILLLEDQPVPGTVIEVDGSDGVLAFKQVLPSTPGVAEEAQ